MTRLPFAPCPDRHRLTRRPSGDWHCTACPYLCSNRTARQLARDGRALLDQETTAP